MDIGAFESLTGDSNNDGVVSQAELDGVLANYWPSFPWLLITNTAGLGTTNVQFALPYPTAWDFTVEVSTNLSDWAPLGPARSIYQFGDPAATKLLTHTYRAPWKYPEYV